MQEQLEAIRKDLDPEEDAEMEAYAILLKLSLQFDAEQIKAIIDAALSLSDLLED